MKTHSPAVIFWIALLCLLSMLVQDLSAQTSVSTTPAQVEKSLFAEIAHMDSMLFDAFNTRNTEKLKTLFTEDLEFYHDKGGLTFYEQNMKSFQETAAKNNGLRRDLVPGSLEVYPIKDYGAIQIGSHTFCHPENGRQDCGTFKFLHVWQKKNGKWKISRVISYDH